MSIYRTKPLLEVFGNTVLEIEKSTSLKYDRLKFNASGASSGDVLTWNGTTVVWSPGGGGTPANVTAGSSKVTLGGTPVGAALQAFSIDVNESNLTLNNIGGTLGVTKGGTGLTALGTANQQIRVNAGATALEYFTPSGTGLTVGTTAIASGTVGRVLFQGSGDVLQQSANLFWNNTDSRLNIGGVGTANGRLTILSPATTGLALHIRNSADTTNQLEFNGDARMSIVNAATGNGLYFVPNVSAGSGYFVGSSPTLTGTNKFLVVAPGSIEVFDTLSGGRTRFTFSTSATGNWELLNSLDRGTFRHTAWSSHQLEMQNGNFSLQDSNARRPSSGARCVLMLTNGTASTNVQDTFQLMAKDIVAGNSAPHFYTENGNEIRLYRQTTAVGSAARVHNASNAIHTDDTFAGYTVAQLFQAIINTGLLA